MILSYWFSRHLQLRNGSGADAGAVIAVVGVALALIVLELCVAITLGFKDEIRRKLMGFDAQVTVLPVYDPYSGSLEQWLEATPELLGIVREQIPEGKVRLSMRQPAIIKTNSDFQGIILHAQRPAGANPDSAFTFERGNIRAGIWPDFSDTAHVNDIVISRPMADKLRVGLGDKLYSNFFIDSDIKARRHTVTGIYESYFGEYDENVAYVSPELLRRVARRDSSAAMRVDIRGLALDDIEASAQRLFAALETAAAEGRLPGVFSVTTVERADAVYFNWLSLLDTNVVVIFVLMLFVAGFTLVSSLFILILEHIPDIGILRALGAGKGMVSNVFVWMALRLVGLGLIIGNAVGLTLILAQARYHFLPLDPQMYYLAFVPVRTAWGAFALLNVGVVAVAWLILILPARLASRIDPAKTMQYE